MSQNKPDESSNEKVNNLPLEPVSHNDDLPELDFDKSNETVEDNNNNDSSENSEALDSDRDSVNLDEFLVESPAEASMTEALPEVPEVPESSNSADEDDTPSEDTEVELSEAPEASKMIWEGSPVDSTLPSSSSVDDSSFDGASSDTSSNDVLVIDTPMGAMTVEKVLFYYETPKFFTARNEDGTLWFSNTLDEDEDSTKLLWAKTDSEKIDSIVKGKNETREAFTKPVEEPLYVVTYFTADGEDAVSAEPIAVSELTDSMLPTAGTFLNSSEEEIEEATELATGMIPTIVVDKATDEEINNNLKSDFEKPSGDPTSEEIKEEVKSDSFSSSPAKVKKKSKTGKIVALSVIGAAILGAGGYFGLNFYNDSKDSTTVPTAVSSIAMGQEISEACKDFINADLNCTAELVPTDLADRGAFISQNLAANEKVKKNTEIVLKYSAGPATSEFPNLKNKTVEEATEELYKNNIVISEVKSVDGDGLEKDRVVDANVKAGTKVENGSEVVLNVSSGKIKLPDWKDKTREFVEADAKKIGVEVEFKTEESDKASGVVISQTPNAGEIASSSKIVVTVSKSFESKDIKVPDVIGKSAEDAQLELATAGFRQINTVTVKNSEVTETQVTQVVPGVGKTGKSEENIVIIVSEPSE